MSTVERLLKQFIAADRDGGDAPDPLAYVEQLTGADREELIVLIDAYLARAPRRAFDREAFAASGASALTDDLQQALDGDAGTWPALLPRLRHRARLTRAQLVNRLAAALGVPAQEHTVHRYYHAMEQGTLPADGVTDRVLEALAAIVGTTADTLRWAGERITPPPASEGGAAFARRARPDPAYPSFAAPPAMASPGFYSSDRSATPVPTGKPDEGTTPPDVDALFTGRRRSGRG